MCCSRSVRRRAGIAVLARLKALQEQPFSGVDMRYHTLVHIKCCGYGGQLHMLRWESEVIYFFRIFFKFFTCIFYYKLGCLENCKPYIVQEKTRFKKCENVTAKSALT